MPGERPFQCQNPSTLLVSSAVVEVSTYETSTHAHTHAHTHSIQCPMDWQWFCSEPSYSLTSATSSPPPPPPVRACSLPQPHTASLFLSLTLSRACPRCLCIHLPLFPRLSVALARRRERGCVPVIARVCTCVYAWCFCARICACVCVHAFTSACAHDATYSNAITGHVHAYARVCNGKY